MDKIFIPQTYRIGKVMKAVEAFKAAGFDISGAARIGTDFEDFITTLEEGDRVVVYSYDFFGGLVAIFETITSLAEEGVTMYSHTEPMFNEEFTLDFVGNMKRVATQIHSNRTVSGIKRATKGGAKLGRPAGSNSVDEQMIAKLREVERLHTVEHFTISTACMLADCPRHSYYTHREKIT